MLNLKCYIEPFYIDIILMQEIYKTLTVIYETFKIILLL